MRRDLPPGVLLVTLLSSSAAAAGPLDQAREALRRGECDLALRLAAAAPPRDEAALVAARAHLCRGRFPEAERLLVAVARRRPASLEARGELGRLYDRLGRRGETKAIWNGFFDDYEGGRLDKGDATALLWVAAAARGLGSYHDAGELYRDALAADPKCLAARLGWAELFLDKYAAGEAEQDLIQALALAPKDADAHALLARVRVEQGDLEAAAAEIAQALAGNPRHPEALRLRGQLELFDEDEAAATRTARALLAHNPSDRGAHTLLAAVAQINDDEAGFAAATRAVLGQNPKAGRFFHEVAELLHPYHRYAAMLRLEERALAVDPTDSIARAGLGQALLRLGREEEGVAALQQAFAEDRFNVRAYNLLNLYEEVIPRRYTSVEIADPTRPKQLLARLRLPKSEAPLLARLVVPLVQAEWKELVARYGFTPQAPLSIELYADPRHYAVRTHGLPSLEALGVTFGTVVTGRSPSGGPGGASFHVGMMLWHELAHVFALEGSGHRVPRWFTEGLAEWETEHHEPTWRRHSQALLYAALQKKQLLPVAALNRGFTHAKTLGSVEVAYHQAAEVVGFLIRRAGFPKVVEALGRFRRGEPVEVVIPAVSGLDLAAFDAAFRADLEARLGRYAGQHTPDPAAWADLPRCAAAAAARPDDARAQALLALALLDRKEEARLGEARAATERALALDPKLPEGHFAAAELAHRRGDGAAIVVALQQMIAAGGDGYVARLKLGHALLRLKRPADAEREWRRAAELDPEQAEVFEYLARLHLEEGRLEAATADLEQATALDPHDLTTVRRLVETLAKRSAWRRLREVVERALLVAPLALELRLPAARALLALGDPATAARELEELQPLVAPGKPRRSVDGLLARALAAQPGELPRARRLAEAVLAEDPASEDAQAVLAGRR